MKYKGRLYSHIEDLEKMLGLPEDVSITNIIHDIKTDEVEFIVRSNEPKEIGAITLQNTYINNCKREHVLTSYR